MAGAVASEISPVRVPVGSLGAAQSASGRPRATRTKKDLQAIYAAAREDLGVYAALCWRDNLRKPLKVERGGIHEELIVLIMCLEKGVMSARCADILNRDLATPLYMAGEPFSSVNVQMPPGLGKSTWITKIAASWLLGRNPDQCIGIVSHAADLAEGFSLAVRNKIASHEFQAVFPGVIPDAKKKWTQAAWFLESQRDETTPTLCAMGIDGSIRGKRWGWVFLDDVVDKVSARTPKQRRKLSEWIRQEVYGRRNAGCKTFNIGNPIHSQDWHGELEASGVPTIKRRSLTPADGSPCTLTVAEMLERGIELKALCPGIFTVEQELARRKDFTAALYEASCQMNPGLASEGKYIKRADLRYLPAGHVVPHDIEIGVAVDCAMSERDQDDDEDNHLSYTVIVEGYRAGDELIATGLFRERCGFLAQEKAVDAIIQAHLACGRSVELTIENRAGGKQLACLLDKTWGGHEQVNITTPDPLQDKPERAVPLIRRIDDRKLVLAEVFKDHEDEIVNFASGLTDVVDALAWLERTDISPTDSVDRETVGVYGTAASISNARYREAFEPDLDGDEIADAINRAMGMVS